MSVNDKIINDVFLSKIFKKNCNQAQTCKVDPVSSDLNQEIKLAILKRAAKIQKGDRKKQLEESGKEIILIDPNDKNAL